jgi:hypothetical protein
MLKNNTMLAQDLKNTDPNGKFTKATLQRAENENNKLKIEELESQKKEYVTAMIATPNPAQKAVFIKKIKDLDDQIAKLKNS